VIQPQLRRTLDLKLRIKRKKINGSQYCQIALAVMTRTIEQTQEEAYEIMIPILFQHLVYGIVLGPPVRKNNITSWCSINKNSYMSL